MPDDTAIIVSSSAGVHGAPPTMNVEKARRKHRMKQLLIVLCGGIFIAALSGCATQNIVQREFYPPDEATLQVREDGMRIGALKSETTRSGSPDWSGNKTFSLFSW